MILVNETMPRSALAPLARGLCINAAAAPRVVVPGLPGTAVPDNACTADIAGALSVNGEGQVCFNEEIAADILGGAFAKWEAKHVPSGALITRQPSCIAITGGPNGLTELYWVDRDIDAARKRRAENDASFLEEQTPPARDTELLGAPGRDNVVRGRVAVVTGGAQGFGEQITLGLAASGALVFIADLNEVGAKKLAEKINADMGRTAAIAAPVNVTSEESVEALFTTIAETSGGFDLCVSNAGVLQAGSVMEQDLRSFKFTTDVNYAGYFIMTKFASRLLRLQHLCAPSWTTDIIQINSKSGLEGSNKNGAYAGSKFGGIGLTESFALELIEYNIKVNAICPGNFFDGPLWSDPEKGLFVQYLNTGKVAGARTIADVRAYYEGKVPMKRGCEGRDVMRAIYYIVEQEYETGQAVPVTGGQTMLH